MPLGHSGGNAPGFAQPGPCMTKAYTFPTIDQYLRERLMPVKGTIPNIVGIDMYGKSIPAGTVGGDLTDTEKPRPSYSKISTYDWRNRSRPATRWG